MSPKTLFAVLVVFVLLGTAIAIAPVVMVGCVAHEALKTIKGHDGRTP